VRTKASGQKPVSYLYGVPKAQDQVLSFTCDDVGNINLEVEIEAIDGNGNIGLDTILVTVLDTIKPVITVTPQTVVLSDNDGTVSLMVSDLASATDACGIASLEASQLLFTCEDIGIVEVLITATDVNGNVSTAPVTVTVQFNQLQLACISDINLTLNDDCQGLLIPSMLLTGNVACLDVFNFDIVVQDNDPSNGPIVDGCGSFTYVISQRSPVDVPNTLGFTGNFAPENWTNIIFALPGGVQALPSDEQIVTLDHSASTLSMTTTTTVFNTGSEFGVQSAIAFGEPASISFDYDYNGSDFPFDQAFSLTTFEGNIVDIPFNTVPPETGSVTFDVAPGYLLFIQLRDDGFTDPGTPPSALTITNFVFDPTPAEGGVFDLDFESCWGTVTAEDKTPPAVATQVAPIDLLCVDLEDNMVSSLPNNVSRCYRVNASTGATVPGTMAAALRDAMSANFGFNAAVVPTFTDGCAPQLEICVTETVEYDKLDPQCENVTLVRTFTATEIAVCESASGESNGSTSSSYTITFTRPSLDDLNTDNVDDVAVYNQCGVTTGTVADIRADYPAPRPQDYPFLSFDGRNFPLQSGQAVCNIGVTYSDGDPIVTCAYTYKFIRTYTIIDWCDPTNVETLTQVVKVGDSTAPTFTGPTQDRDFDGVIDGDLVYTTNAGNVCAAYIVLDGPGVGATDNCSSTVTVTATIFPGGDLGATPIGSFVVDFNDGNAEVTTPIPVGTHIIRYTFEDDCLNSDFEDFEFTVIDGTAPVAICEDGLNISVSSGQTQGPGPSTGVVVLTPEMIDAGSYDDCSGVTLSIARVCVQLITVRGIFSYRVTFPTDEASGCADIPSFDGLDTDEYACDLITTNVTVDTIAAVNAPDACFTLRVNYDVINFCEYNQLGECYRIPRDGDGIRNPDTQLLYLNIIPNSTANTSDDIAFLSRFTDRNFNPGPPQRDQLVDDGDDNDGSDDDNDNDSEETQAANGVGFAYAQTAVASSATYSTLTFTTKTLQPFLATYQLTALQAPTLTVTLK
jgi:hypothetical protein